MARNNLAPKWKLLALLFFVCSLHALARGQESTKLENREPILLLDEDALKRPSQSRDLYRLLRTLRSPPNNKSLAKQLTDLHRHLAVNQKRSGHLMQKPVVVMPAKKSRAKEVAAYDYTGPSDIEIYDNGVVRMAADGKSSRAKKWL